MAHHSHQSPIILNFKMRLHIVLFFFSIILLFTQCIDPVNIELPPFENKLVVFGKIDNGKDPYTILLSRTATYDVYVNPIETGALVFVEDSIGQRITFEEEEPGQYVSCYNGNRGSIGGKYQLNIITDDGKEYKSTWQEILPPAELLAIGYEYKEIENNNDINSIDRGIAINCSFKDNEEREYFKIDWNAIYKFRANALDEKNRFCWNQEKSKYSVDLYSDEYANNKRIDFVPVTFLESGLRFTNEYHIKVTVESIPRSAYDFWKLVQQQNQTNGSAFSALPSKVLSNIVNVNDSSEEVLGIFYAAGITSLQTEIPLSIIPGRIEAELNCKRFKFSDPLPEYCYDCTKFQNSVSSRPEL